MKPFVVVAYHHVPERFENFKKLIDNLNKIPNIKLIILSNIIFDTNYDITVPILDDPYHLTWIHKKYMQEFLNSDYTHFAYLEGNIEVTKKTFDYWCRTRELFKRNNLNFIPATHRIQIHNNQVYSLDCTHIIRGRPTIEVEGKKFISLPEPYQGMFIMDREMVEEHVTSDFFIMSQKHNYGIRESANLGNIYVNVPSGHNHRAMIPLNNFSECWTPHFGTDYHNDANSPHAKIKIENLFDGYQE